MTETAGRTAVREQLVTGVVVGIGSDLLRYGVERMSQSLDCVSAVRFVPDVAGAIELAEGGRDVLVVRLAEVDVSTRQLLNQAGERGVKILLLIDDDDLTELSKVVGISGAGFLAVSSLSEGTLYDAISRMCRGEVPIPAMLAHSLLAMAGERAEPARSQPRITPREQEVLLLMVEGLSNKQIARRLRISEHGAKRLVANILAKTDCTNRTVAVAKALREGLYEQCAQARAR